MPNYNIISQGSTKIAKSNKIQDRYFSRIVYLAPDDLADGKNTLCPYAKIAKCSEACLNTAGMGKFSNVQQSRIKKSLSRRRRASLYALLLRDDTSTLCTSEAFCGSSIS